LVFKTHSIWACTAEKRLDIFVKMRFFYKMNENFLPHFNFFSVQQLFDPQILAN